MLYTKEELVKRALYYAVQDRKLFLSSINPNTCSEIDTEIIELTKNEIRQFTEFRIKLFEQP